MSGADDIISEFEEYFLPRKGDDMLWLIGTRGSPRMIQVPKGHWDFTEKTVRDLVIEVESDTVITDAMRRQWLAKHPRCIFQVTLETSLRRAQIYIGGEYGEAVWRKNFGVNSRGELPTAVVRKLNNL